MSRTVVGVDIGATAVRAVEITEANRRRPTLERAGEVLLPRGVVQDGSVIDSNALSAALRRLWREQKFGSKQVALGVGNKRVMVRDVTLPAMPSEQLKESLAFQVEDLLPVAVADALLDFYPVSRAESASGWVVNGLLVAAIKEPVRANIDVIRSAGLKVAEVDLIGFAQTRALARRGENSKQTVALVDLGAHTTNVVIVDNGVPQFVRIIGTGGEDVSQNLATGLDLPRDDADRLKQVVGLKAGDTPEARRIAELVAAVVNPLLVSLRDTIGYYNSAHVGEPIRRILLTGGASALPGLADGLQAATRTEVVSGDPVSELAPGKALDVGAVRARASTLTVAIGLALGENDDTN